METYHKTAIKRKKPSAPAAWLYKNVGFDLDYSTLDYGCGRGDDADYYGIQKWDPISDNWDIFSLATYQKYKTILCTYVLNVLSTVEERIGTLESIKRLLAWDGTAYIAVRNDKKNLNGWTKKGTFQTFVELDYPVVHKTSGYIIYEVTP